ncbi:MAG TPA: HRDC domain-containing protein [Pyrinomonadaceae bacterium]
MSDASLIEGRSYRFISDTGEAREALEPLLSETLVGLDTETYWDAAAKCGRLSLMQVASAAGQLLVIDALSVDVETLRPLVESASVSMAAHNARFDEMILSNAGLRPVAFIDTLQMARLTLSLPSYSLASVVEHLFGIPLDKSLQQSNWKRRPLTRSQLGYAATDALATLRVYEELARRLAEEGRLEEVLRYSTLRARPENAESKPRRRRRVPQVPEVPLTAEEKQIVAELKRWRMAQANAQRRPAYMVCADKTLEHLARERPSTLDALVGIYGLGESKIERFGAELLAALSEALERLGDKK